MSFTMQVPALTIAMDMENAQLKVFAYVKMDLPELTVPRVNIHYLHRLCHVYFYQYYI